MKIVLPRSGRRLRRRPAALLAATVLGAASLIAAAPVPASAAGAVAVTYTTSANWGYGLQAELTITPSVAVTNGWTLSFDAGDQQTLTLAAYAGATQSGRHVTLTNRVFNGTIAAGATLNLVVQFSNPTFSDVPPTGFVFNDQAAAYTPSPYVIVSDAKPTVPEGGTNAITVQLSQAPSSAARFSVIGGSSPTIAAAPGQLTFDATDWNVPQTVTLSSPRDADTGNQTTFYQIEQTSGFPTLYSTDVFLAIQIDNG